MRGKESPEAQRGSENGLGWKIGHTLKDRAKYGGEAG